MAVGDPKARYFATTDLSKVLPDVKKLNSIIFGPNRSDLIPYLSNQSRIDLSDPTTMG